MREAHLPGTSTRRVVVHLIALLACCSWPAAAAGQFPKRYQLGDLQALESAFVELAEEVRLSVVAIQTYYVRNPGVADQRPVKIPVSRGSGFVLTSDGYIATNRHVLEDANDFAVILDTGVRYDAKVIQTDPRSDLAVMRIDATGLKPVRWGNLVDVRVNQWTFAVGNPFGLANMRGHMSVTFGVVSALGRDMTGQLAGRSLIPYYGNLIETTSAINPGNSGGPLFNLDREVIGVVTAIETASGVGKGAGFAIPIDTNTRHILDTLKAGKVVRYGFLGVEVGDPVRQGTRRVVRSPTHPGVEIRRINVADGPAARAGLHSGDLLIEYNDTPLQNTDHLVRLVSFTPVGAEVTIKFLRKGVKRKARLTVGDRYELLGIAIPE